IFFVTSADSAVLVLASMSTDEAGDPPLKRNPTPPSLRKPAFAVAVAPASAGAGRSPARTPTPVLATVIIPVHTSLPI
ncbi:hypothetical protein, partial [Stenotrophomonas sepilia]|uniref:hypothetical protein n=1 Tax=Stenotrophomonas sepilia TaxID=2860290 RepID=UPI003341CFC9